MAVHHFLLVYDLAAQRLVAQRQFDEVKRAVAAYAAAEREHLGQDDVEIVLIGSDSIETVRHTHGSYFDGEVAAPRSKYLAQLG